MLEVQTEWSEAEPERRLIGHDPNAPLTAQTARLDF
jgi:hypothetical protein